MKPDTLPYLLRFQAWRRGQDERTMDEAGITPALTTATLDDAIAELEKIATQPKQEFARPLNLAEIEEIMTAKPDHK